MRHPIEKYNQIQAEQLANFAPEEREFWAHQFRVGDAAYCYQYQCRHGFMASRSGTGVAPATRPHGFTDAK